MARLFSGLVLVTVQYMLLNGSRRYVKVVYKPYGPEMCREVCKDFDDTFVYLKEELSCHRISRDNITRSHTTGDSFTCPRKGKARKVRTSVTAQRGLQTCGTNSKGKASFNHLQKLATEATTARDLNKMILLQACKDGNLCAVKHILYNKLADINCREQSSGRTPVMAAAIKGQVEVFQFLVSQGCNLSAVDINRDTVLHLSCMGGKIDIVRKLVVKKFDVDSRGYVGLTPVMNAALYGYIDIFIFLKRHGCNVTLTDEHNNNVLHVACMGGSVDMVQHILSQNICSTESREYKGRTPVMIAAQNGYIEVVTLLVSKHCELGVTDNRKNNILHLACTGGHADMVRYVLSKQLSSINNRGSSGRTPLMMAAKKGHLDVLRLLLRKGSNLLAQDDHRYNILHMACIGGDMHTVEYIISQNVSGLESIADTGRTPVLIAASKGHTRVVELLVRKGCNVTAVDHEMNNILHCACIGGHVDTVKYLMKLEGIRKMDRNKLDLTPAQLVKGKNRKTITALLNARK